MGDIAMLAVIGGVLLLRYVVQELDPNQRTAEQAERDAWEVWREQRERDARRGVEQESGEATR